MSQAQAPFSGEGWLRRTWRENRGTLIVLAIIALAFVALRSSPSDVASVEVLQADLRAGHPTLLYFYSNTWSACLVAKPAVDGLERTVAPQGVPVIRLSVASGIGRQLASAYAVRGVPTLILVDGDGQQRLIQVGRVQRESMMKVVTELLYPN